MTDCCYSFELVPFLSKKLILIHLAMFTMTAAAAARRRPPKNDGVDIAGIVDEELRLHREKQARAGEAGGEGDVHNPVHGGGGGEVDVDDIRVAEDVDVDLESGRGQRKKGKGKGKERRAHQQSASNSEPSNDLMEDLEDCCVIS